MGACGGVGDGGWVVKERVSRAMKGMPSKKHDSSTRKTIVETGDVFIC